MSTKKDLQNFSVFALREIGRELGVKSPSTLKKRDLIEAIINLENGLTKPYFSTKGRPLMKNKTITEEKEITSIKDVNTNKKRKEYVEKELDNIYEQFKTLVLDLIN